MRVTTSRATASSPLGLPRVAWALLAYASGPVAPVLGPALVWAARAPDDAWIGAHAVRAAGLQVVAAVLAFATGVGGQLAGAAVAGPAGVAVRALAGALAAGITVLPAYGGLLVLVRGAPAEPAPPPPIRTAPLPPPTTLPPPPPPRRASARDVPTRRVVRI